MNKEKFSSTQQTPLSMESLRASYEALYTEGWMKTHHNHRQYEMLIEASATGPGMLHLDVASGLSYSLDIVEGKGATAIGLELSLNAILQGKKENANRVVLMGNGEYIPFEDDTFDSITCLGSLEHFISPEKGAAEIARVLKKEGYAAILLPNSHNLLAIYNVYKFGGILSEQQDFERFGTRLEWQAFLENNGLHVVEVRKFNVGFARIFKKGREFFWFLYNILYKLLSDSWIPINLSYNLIFICTKT